MCELGGWCGVCEMGGWMGKMEWWFVGRVEMFLLQQILKAFTFKSRLFSKF